MSVKRNLKCMSDMLLCGGFLVTLSWGSQRLWADEGARHSGVADDALQDQQEARLAARYRQGFSIQVEEVELEVLLSFIAREFGWRLALDIDETLRSLPVSLSVAEDSLDQVLAAIPSPGAGDLVFQLEPPQMRVGWAGSEAVQALPVATSEPLLETRFYQVHYADALSLLSLIQDVPGTEGWLSARGRAQLDERSNTLVVTDVHQRLGTIEVLLSELDVPVSQVLVQAWIVSASLDSARQLGVHWQALHAENEGTANPDHWSLSLGSDLSVTGGLNRHRFRLEMDLAAMQAAGQVELLARPSIMTRANQQASIQSGVRVPYQSQAGGTAGGSVTQFVDAVLSLAVLPRITPDGQVHMDLEVRQDAVAAGNASVPAINTNTISTQVRLDNRDTLVLGGIFTDQVRENESAVPVLSRIPGVGKLFRQTHHATQRSELLIFITPVIIPAH